MADVAGFHVVDVLEFVPAFDEFVDFFVLCVDLFFEFALGFDEVLVAVVRLLRRVVAHVMVLPTAMPASPMMDEISSVIRLSL